MLLGPLSPLHSLFTSLHLHLHLYPHSCFFTTLLTLPLSIPVLFRMCFQSFILVFPVPREYSLHISSGHSHRLLSWCNSLADIPSCTYQSPSPAHSYIVYSKLLQCWPEVQKVLAANAHGLWFVRLHTAQTWMCKRIQSWGWCQFASSVKIRLCFCSVFHKGADIMRMTSKEEQ